MTRTATSKTAKPTAPVDPLAFTSSKPPMTLSQAIDAGQKALITLYAYHQVQRFERARKVRDEGRYMLWFQPGYNNWTHIIALNEKDGRGWCKGYRIVTGGDAVKRAYRSYVSPEGVIEDTDEPCADLLWCERFNEELKAAGLTVRLETYHAHLSHLLEQDRKGGTHAN